MGTGIDDFVDGIDLGSGVFEPDRFYLDRASQLIERERTHGPLFLYVYLTANHFTWDYQFHEELTPTEWRDPGNATPEANEYLRRQAMTERDYKEFLARLKREYPEESFLIVRYGDHQPEFSSNLLDPGLDEASLARKFDGYDPRYFTTYYAIDAVNFKPAAIAAALKTIEGPYLPLVVLENAGLPLDSSFEEQKRIMQRCNGLFFNCNGGAEARRFNRMLIDAGMIKGL
jgi:hypothetical protein